MHKHKWTTWKTYFGDFGKGAPSLQTKECRVCKKMKRRVL